MAQTRCPSLFFKPKQRLVEIRGIPLSMSQTLEISEPVLLEHVRARTQILQAAEMNGDGVMPPCLSRTHHAKSHL